MDLFRPILPENKWHQHFRTILTPPFESSRKVMQQWAEGFPDRDGKFVQEFQHTFNSSFWELYLYAVFRNYDFSFDWRYPSPDFLIEHNNKTVCIEAVTANAADGKPNEWDMKEPISYIQKLNLNKINREAMIRLANAIYSKHKKYKKSYSLLPHVKSQPFVLAVAPFEQPFFNHQYNRPIMAVLYDQYIDEAEYTANPAAYPNGPRSKQLGLVTKDNGADIQLGLFNDDHMREISAVIFSCTATMGKVHALAPEDEFFKTFSTQWGSEPDGRPIIRSGRSSEIGEVLTDGIQVYHNPYALHPLDLNLFRCKGVVQIFFDETKGQMVEEEINCSLYSRHSFRIIPHEGNNNAR